MSALDAFLSVGRAIGSKLSDAAKNLVLELEGDGDDSEAEELHADAVAFGHAAVLFRPAPSDGNGSCEFVFARWNDEALPIASRDIRWQLDLEEGEVVVRAFGSGAALLRLRPDGTVVIEGEIDIGGSAAEAMVLGDSLKQWLELHTHPSAMGPTGPPSEAGQLSTILSTKHTVD